MDKGYNWETTAYYQQYVENCSHFYITSLTGVNMEKTFYAALSKAVRATRIYLGACDFAGSKLTTMILPISATELWMNNTLNCPNDVPVSFGQNVNLNLLNFDGANFDIVEVDELLDNVLAAINAGMGSSVGGAKTLRIAGSLNAVATNTSAITAIEAAGWTIVRNT